MPSQSKLHYMPATLTTKTLIPKQARQPKIPFSTCLRVCPLLRWTCRLCSRTSGTVVRTLSTFLRDGVLERTKFTVLSEAERLALAEILVPFEPLSLPYS